MNLEDIICMAREAGMTVCRDEYGWGLLKRFATLVAADEREACAQIAQEWDASHPETNYGACIANAIRARG